MYKCTCDSMLIKASGDQRGFLFLFVCNFNALDLSSKNMELYYYRFCQVDLQGKRMQERKSGRKENVVKENGKLISIYLLV